MKINVSIFGASGYTGTQLLSILINHKNVNISGVYGDKTSGKRLRDLFPYVKNIPDILISSYEDFKSSYCDLAFLCLPHQRSEIIIDKIKTLKVIDLSSDFRIKDEKHYFDWYNSKHPKPDLLSKFVYGLSELNRSKIKSSNLVILGPQQVHINTSKLSKNIKLFKSIYAFQDKFLKTSIYV